MSQERVDVLIVVALRGELSAVLEQGADARAGWSEARDSTGATYYVRTEPNTKGQLLRIAVAWLGDSGQATATMRSRRLVDELDPSCLALCGVCVGRRGLLQAGDVIVADRVFDLGMAQASSKDPASEHSTFPVYELDLAWKMNVAALADDAQWMSDLSRRRPPSISTQAKWLLRQIFDRADFEGNVSAGALFDDPDRIHRCPNWSESVQWLRTHSLVGIRDSGAMHLWHDGRREAAEQKATYPDGSPLDPPFQVHVGTIVTATDVFRDDEIFVRAAPYTGKLLGADLESTAIASVATHLSRRWIVSRGVADYAGHPKRENSLFTFAAYSAAAILMTFLKRYFDVGSRVEPPSDRAQDQQLDPLLLERISINGFKNITELVIDTTADSKLPGRWTCLAGINGSGKTSILQAIALALLGDKLSEQLGSKRLSRMVRQGEDSAGLGEVTVTVRAGSEVQTLSLPLCSEGIDSARLAKYPSIKEMRALWDKRARRGILAAYGASRNLSEFLDNRYESLHAEVQRQMTLFDPLARVARADLLLSEDPHLTPVVQTLSRLLAIVLADLPVRVAEMEASLRFEIDGALLPASALPDGFRSTVAWLADLCALWHEKAQPDDKGDGDPKLIHGIVLVDEIDLHLHPSLQRVLVPRLREAMPRVQWVVTTHSPLVLASFDRHEIKMLDSTTAGGVRQLDRDIIGFSMDQIYDWLMDTKPRGIVLEEMLARAEHEPVSPEEREELAVLVATAPDFNEEDAKKRVAWRRGLLDRLKKGEPLDTEKKD